MHHRYEHINIPIEVIRTVVTVAECGSFSKAGLRLALSQPAISAQIKRLQAMVGDQVFRKTHGRIELTERGALVLAHARKILDANDQILALGGRTSQSQPVRIGLSVHYAEEFFKVWAGFRESVSLMCGHSTDIEKSLEGGHLDVASVLNPTVPSIDVAAHWIEEFAWSRAPNFTLTPGNPIPIISSLNAAHQQPAIYALEKAKLAYRIAFSSNDRASCLAAAANCVGLMAMPRRFIRKPLIAVDDCYLPKLEPMAVGICVRPGGALLDDIKTIVECLMRLAPKSIEMKSDAIRCGTASKNVKEIESHSLLSFRANSGHVRI